MTTRFGWHLGLAAVLTFVGSSPAQAVGYHVSATVQSVDPTASGFPASLANVTVGTPVTIAIGFDAGVPPYPNFLPAPYSQATYYLLDFASICVTVGTETFTNSGTPWATVWNNDPITSPTLADGVAFGSTALYGPWIFFSNMTLPASTFANESLPTTAIPGDFVLQLTAAGAGPAYPWLTATWNGLTPATTASYTTFGSGCPGSLGVPGNVCYRLPRSGQELRARFTNMPMNLGVVTLGLSNTVGTYSPLPLDLGLLGAPGCFARVRFDATAAVVGSSGAGDFTMSIPPDAIFLGFTFYTQALVFDASANGLGLIASDAAVAVVGV